MFQEIIPETLEDTILSYLKSQEVIGESFNNLGFEMQDVLAEEEVKGILHELILKVNKRIACRDRYDNLKLWHHQYPLFDLNTFVPNFCIDDEMFEKLTFRESLLISALESGEREVEPKPVGGLCLDVQMAQGRLPEKTEMPTDSELDRQVFQILQKIKLGGVAPVSDSELEKDVQLKLKEYEKFLEKEIQNNVKKFVVHFSSQFQVNGCNAGSSITTWADRDLHTLEEKRKEFILQPDGINEKSVYVAIQNQKYYMRHTSKPDGLEVRKNYPFFVTRNMMCEGANFVLMRYLAITKFVGTFEMSTMYINGSLCRNIYECTGPIQGEVNDKTIDICKIYRYIIEETGIEHHGVTVLTTYGRLITQEWEACNYILNLNPLQYVDNEKPCSYERLVLTKTWQDDLQLMSKYLDCKTTAEREMKTYMADHPEIREMINDFVQNVLLLKPANILAFTMDYFQNMCPGIPRMSYCESDNRGSQDDY